MTETPFQPVAVPTPARRVLVRAFGQRPAVYGVLIAYTAVSTALMLVRAVGVTSEHALLICLVFLSIVAPARAFVWDWLPFLGVGVMFSDLGAFVTKSAAAAHTVDPIGAEQSLLGGNVAAVWLQQHVRPLVPWLDVPLGLVYLTFFAAPMLFGLWLWVRHRTHFGNFVAAYIGTMAVGFLTYVLYPETPPWLAARAGFLPHIDRVTVSLLNHLGPIGHLYGAADPAPYGAMPALHVTVPALIALTIIGLHRGRGWRQWTWLLYPAMMFLAVMYLGEHYLLDAVAGLLLGVVMFLLVGRGADTASTSDQRRPRPDHPVRSPA